MENQYSPLILIHDRNLKELTDDVAEQLSAVKFEKGKWRLGGVFYKPYWRTFLQVDIMDYDVLLPGLFKTEAEAEAQAKRLTFSFLRDTPQKKG